MSLLTSILFILVLARILGQLMVRLKQPEILGEMLAGILLGPAILGLIEPTPHLAGISELSVFLIVLSAGLEMEVGDVINAFRGRGLFLALIGFFLPFISGILLGVLFGMDPFITLFLGLAISITALPVAIRILESFRLLSSPIAQYAIATAIVNDIAAILGIGILLDLPGKTTSQLTLPYALSQLGFGFIKLVLFAAFVIAISRFLQWGSSQTRYIEKGLSWLMNFLGKEALFGVAVLFVLILASLSEALGSHFVIGAFLGALLLNKDVLGVGYFSELNHTLASLTSGFLGPIFFSFLGLHFSWTAFEHPLLVFSVLGVSIGSKILAGYWGGLWAKLSKRDALGLGIILNGRGIMELVVANIAFQQGFINQELFSTLIFMGIVTTLITPILFRSFKTSTLLAEKPSGAPNG